MAFTPLRTNNRFIHAHSRFTYPQGVFRMSRSLRLGIIYLIFGAFWIICTDWLLLEVTHDHPHLLPGFMKVKGLVFIALSAVLLYLVNKADNKALIRSVEENKSLSKKYDALRAASKEAIYEYDLQADTVHINPYLQQIFGLKNEFMRGGWNLWQEKVHPSDHERISNGMMQQLQSGETTWQDEYQLMDSQGKYRTVIHTCFVIKDDHGKPNRVMGTLLDISELKNLQKKYYQQEMRNKVSLMKAIVKAQEDERNRWAIEMHDNIGQLLAVTKLYLCNFSDSKIPDKDMLDRTRDIVQLSLTEIRQLSARLKTPVFDDQSLSSAIKSLAGNINRVKEIQFHINIDADDKELQEEHKLMIYRIIQEQLSNIIKYAEAQTVLISVKRTENLVRFSVTDDGRGFDTSKDAVGIGFKNIRSRLKVYKGNMQVNSSPGEGCALTAEFLI